MPALGSMSLGILPRNLKQYRADGILIQASAAVRKRVLELKDLTWAQLSEQPAFAKHPSEGQALVYGKVQVVPHDSPTAITCGVLRPQNASGTEPSVAPDCQ